MRALQTMSRRLRDDITAFDIDIGAEGCQCLQMQIDRAGP